MLHSKSKLHFEEQSGGGNKIAAYATGAYARIRRQFGLSIGKFEGVEEPLARIAAFTYIMDAIRTLATAAIDAGEKPSVASAIVKYHTTELGRKTRRSRDYRGASGEDPSQPLMCRKRCPAHPLNRQCRPSNRLLGGQTP